MKNSEQAEFHKYIYEQLVKSITDSGDGKSPETAFIVIEVHEEYVVLESDGDQDFAEIAVTDAKGGHSYDELVVDDSVTNKTQKIYFNVDIPIKHGA